MLRMPLTMSLPSPAATEAFAQALSKHVWPGCVLLLEGSVGAGKTAFARALIGALRDGAGLPAEDVPSPTFTLVQTYDTGAFETWHADLYRLTDPAEVLELGLDAAFDDALCLIEWPDRLGSHRPAGVLTLTLTSLPGESRHVALAGPAEALDRLAPAFAGLPA